MEGMNTTQELIEEIKKGHLILVLDDETRENEGDFICAAEFATTENVNFMATYGKGLICMPMPASEVTRLQLEPMCKVNGDNHETAFTESIDHVDTTTGISAVERSMTAMKTVTDGAQSFRRPGHMFPLKAVEGGVLKRNGHTEATVDFAKLAGLSGIGLCCEIMSADGTMARKEELLEIAKKHQIKIGTIEDLIAYRKKTELLVEKAAEADFPSKYGQFRIHAFVNQQNGEHHVALTMGDIANKEPVLTRVHSECLTGDAFGSGRCDCGEQLEESLRMIGKEGRGVLIYLRQEGRGIGLVNKLKAYELQDTGLDTVEANLQLGFPEDMRDYTVGSQMLTQLGVHQLRLMTNNPLKIQGLEEYGIQITERVPIQIPSKPSNLFYLKTKEKKMGHLVNY